MKVSGEYFFPASSLAVWQCLLDPEALQKAIRGCRRITRKQENQYEIEIGVVVGSVRGTFLGNIALDDLKPPASYKITVDSSGKAGFVRGTGLIRLEANGEDTRVVYDGEVQVGGVIASVGQRMIEAVSKRMTNDFFGSMRKNL